MQAHDVTMLGTRQIGDIYTPAERGHRGDDGARAQEGAPQGHLDVPPPCLGVDPLNRSDLRPSARRVDEERGRPETRGHLRDQVGDGPLIRHVGRVRQRTPAGHFDRGSRGDELDLGARRQGDGCSRVGERLGDRAADTSACAGNDRDLTPKR